MKRLYRRYGNQLVVLDAVYRNGMFHVPTFFLLVRTNVGYRVVAVIVVQLETPESLRRAIEVVKFWSPDVSPKYAMVDSSEQEISALELSFPGMSVMMGSVFETESLHQIRCC